MISTSPRLGDAFRLPRTGLNRRTVNARRLTWTSMDLQQVMMFGHGSSSRGPSDELLTLKGAAIDLSGPVLNRVANSAVRFGT